MTEVTPDMLAKIPGALYGCADIYCAADASYPDFQLTWFSGSKDPDEKGRGTIAGFYCFNCEDALGIECDGPSLAYVLKHSLTDAILLQR